MEKVQQLDPRQMKELLIKCWMTHDAMWLYHCLQECGIETANKVNRAAVRSMATVEIKRLKNMLGNPKMDRFDTFYSFFQTAMATFADDFMKYSYESHGQNHLRSMWQQCFAHDGMAALGFIDQYECGIMDRIEGWFDNLGIQYTVEPKVTHCMMHTEGRCYRDYTFFFDR